MTYAEAKKKLQDEGYQGEPTPEALALAGWDVNESIRETKAIGASEPTFTDEQMRQAAAALHEEMKANNVPANILKIGKTLLGGAAKAGLIALMLCALFFTSGCSFRAAQQHNSDVELLATSFANKKAKREAAQIADYRRTERAKVDKLTADSIESEKKRTDITPAQIADNCVVHMKLKAQKYAEIEENCIKMQSDFNSDRSDVIQLSRKNSELREYFKGQNDTGELVKDTSKILIDTLKEFKDKKPEKPD
ncbi:MAG TPA: hypothetical protein VEK08_27025 [Planctomycetota bacterium]|nr:hypothetical protein [Planctomycetota bacterium]